MSMKIATKWMQMKKSNCRSCKKEIGHLESKAFGKACITCSRNVLHGYDDHLRRKDNYVTAVRLVIRGFSVPTNA